MDSHVVSARRRGVGDARIEALSDPTTWPDHFDDRERAALGLADAVSGDRSNQIDGPLIAALRQHFDETELAELILVAGQANLNNRAGNAAKQLLGSRADR